jgi:hypothetical protein
MQSFFGGVVFPSYPPETQAAMSCFAPQTRSAHAAIGKLKHGSHAEPKQRVGADAARIGYVKSAIHFFAAVKLLVLSNAQRGA